MRYVESQGTLPVVISDIVKLPAKIEQVAPTYMKLIKVGRPTDYDSVNEPRAGEKVDLFV